MCLSEIIKEFWKDIADFEKHEITNDSKNQNLATARQGARMEAYVKLFEKKITKTRNIVVSPT